jgi:hypothetical protein
MLGTNLSVVKIFMFVFGIVTLETSGRLSTFRRNVLKFCHEDGDYTFLRNVCIHLEVNRASQQRTL